MFRAKRHDSRHIVNKTEWTIENNVLVKYQGKAPKLIVPQGVQTIGSSAFAGNPFVKEIVIPSGVETISRWAFYYCTSLREVSIPQGVKYIGEEAFRICRALESIELPAGIETIEQLVFSGCSFLRRVSMPASVVALGARAFWGCKRLELVTLGGRKIPPELLNNEFRPPLRKDDPFPEPGVRAIPPEIHVAWRVWIAASETLDVLDAPSRIFLQEQGDKVCAALGYDAETLKFIAKHRLITKEVALRAAVQCSARGFVEATALLMELAQGLNVTNDPTFCQQIC